MNFDFATAGKIIFGDGRIKELPVLARAHGGSALLVIGKSSAKTDAIARAIGAAGISVSPFHVAQEPTIQLVSDGAAQVRYRNCDSIIAIGGGSVMDAGKAIAALATNRRPILDYLEVIGKGEPLLNRPLPIIAAPTTAGSGAEVTRNAVLASPEHKVKVSLRHPSMLPAVAIVDPELTHSMPPAATAATGLDALSQLIEPFVSKKANPFTDGLCKEGLDRMALSLRRVFHYGQDAQARGNVSLASLFGGLALANAGLGAVHGFAAPIGAEFAAPHGAVCAALLPVVMRVNIRETMKDAETHARYLEIARRLTGNPAASVLEGPEWIEGLIKEFNIPGLASYGLREEHLPKLIEKAKAASSMRGNPVELEDLQLTEILLRAS